jgi:predicted ATPase
MKLASIHLRHYRSLNDVRIDFDERATVLVGRNGAGKSNVVDGLRFLRDAIANDLEHAVSIRGGMAWVRQHSNSKSLRVELGVHLKQDELDTDLPPATYEFSIESLSAGKFVVAHERASFCYSDDLFPEPIAARIERDRSGRVRPDTEHQHSGNEYSVDHGGLALSKFGSDAREITEFMLGWQFSSIDPNVLQQPNTPSNEAVLNEDGRNWASVIKALRRNAKGRKTLERIGDAMRCVLPTFDEVLVSSVGNYLVPSFKFANEGKSKISFDPRQLSDGTLRIFGILLALYQLPAPKLLVIEEPELSVQPGVMAVLAEAFSEASEETQIIITTHSPSLVDHFKPEQVRVVTLEDGLTKVSRVKSTQIEAVKRNLMSMQDFMLAEGLQPELP